MSDASPSFLAQLGLTPAQTPELRSNDRSRLLNFLLRWNYIAELRTCLDEIIPRNKPLVSLIDLRVQALLAEGRSAEALPLMQERFTVQPKTSFAGQSLLARVHLALGDISAAHEIAQRAAQAEPDSLSVWGLLGDVELARGDITAAQTAYRRIGDQFSDNRTYLLGMMEVYRARNDGVTATAYAVRALRIAEETETPLAVSQLRRLLDYFRASDNVTRAADVEAELERLYAAELAALQAALAQRPGVPAARPRAEAAAPVDDQSSITLLGPDHNPAFPVSDEERITILDAVERLFGFRDVLPGQMETVACVLRGEDVLTILPTGGGKSLCYQLPAFIAESGLTLVISPLIALMKDQVDSLPGGVRARATTINSSLDGDELRCRLEQVAAGGYRLVYAAPERLRQPPFLHTLRRAGINRLVIDEAHCVSVWGHDFRPDYLYIGAAREMLGRPPLLALTATAPPRVRQDIIQRLGEMRVIAGDVTRPNLRLSVYYAANTDDKLQHLLAFCKGRKGSGIVYAGTRERCETLAALLRQHGMSAVHYHAGMDNRAQVQDDFMAGRVDIVVATVAFGMGIDKPDIRFIAHFVPPNSLEAYYQEAGRAGRDGQPAECMLMYTTSDRGTLTRRANQDVLPVEFLRNVYAAVRRRLNGQTAGPVASADLERDLAADETRVRVALSLLEQAGMLRRGADLPRSVSAQLTRAPQADVPVDFVAFCQAARKPGQSLPLDLSAVARDLGLAPDELEPRLLAWADAGWLTYLPAGRDFCLTLLPPPADAAERVAALLERYATIQAQRVDEISAYAQTGRCRHGYLNAYLGGRTIERCAACDNCVGDAPVVEAALPDEREQALTVLRALAESRGWGKATLTRLLRGDAKTPDNARGRAGFGALAFRSETALAALIDRLDAGGFLQGRKLDHGGVVLEITLAGRKALQDPAALDAILSPPAPKISVQPTLTGEVIAAPEPDAALLKKLTAWRLALAKEKKVPSYVIFNNQTLEEIALHKPTTPETLEKIKGIGPSKMGHYGETVVELVIAHLEDHV